MSDPEARERTDPPETPQPAAVTRKEASGVDALAVKRAVRDRYSLLAAGGSCCGGSCDSGDPLEPAARREPPTDSGSLSSLGCGNPLASAELRPGETVLDLGCGAGAEVLAAARRVGPAGRAIGVDMTDEMLERSRSALGASGLGNVEFLKGEIESLPLPKESVDVIVSNCVLNLSPDKTAALREALRVLKPGGRFVVADIVIEGDVEPDPAWRGDLSRWSACQTGALTEGAYARALSEAGFVDVRLERISEPGADSCCGRDAPREVVLASALIRARKPRRERMPSQPTSDLPTGAPDGMRRSGEEPSAGPRLLAVDDPDLPGVRALLVSAGLDPAGLEAPNVRAFGIADGVGVAACVAYEVEGESLLLRSLAVRQDLRSRGLGESLLERALDHGRQAGLREAFLLTESAAAFFAARGWDPVARAVVDGRFPRSEQTRRVCPASAAAMRRTL